MKDKRISCCYFPSMAILIDDNQHFLDSIIFKLDDKLAYQSYDKPYQALEFLKEKYQSCLKVDKWISANASHQDYKSTNLHPVNINVGNIYQELYNLRRFNEISLVMVDYSMPSINGVDFCRQISDLPVKKVLVTGEADHDIAIRAFNDGIIDQFIRKDAYDFTQRINQIIFGLQKNYFQDFSETIAEILSLEQNYPFADPIFAEFFDQLCKEREIMEYYLFEKIGSFLLLDINAKPSWLIVKDEMQLKTFYQEIKNNNISFPLQEQLKDNFFIPFFGMKTNPWEISATDWSNHLYPTKKIKGSNTYYHYALIENPKINDLDIGNVVSYREYLGL